MSELDQHKRPTLIVGNKTINSGISPDLEAKKTKSRTILPTPKDALPCPFCGKLPKFIQVKRIDGSILWSVSCSDLSCTLARFGALITKTDPLEKLVEVWNNQPYANRLNEDMQSYDSRYDFTVHKLQEALIHLAHIYSDFLFHSDNVKAFHEWIQQVREKDPMIDKAVDIIDAIIKEELKKYENTAYTK